MKRPWLAAVAAAFAVAACSNAEVQAPAETASTTLSLSTAIIRSPDGSLSVVYGGEADPTLVLSAGFLRRSPVGEVAVPSRLSWSPNSRGFYVNDSGSASWSTFRLWSANARAQAIESTGIREEAIAELGRLNGCDSVPGADATTHGMGWSPDGSRVYVLAQSRRQTGECIWKDVDYIVVVADVESGQVVEIEQGEEARRRWPTLPWAPVTTP
ncbi:MAG: hypothetical protein Q8R97_09510 [Brevundimonas sp.]|uniref:hypothetical protein n=1 Tax=Brevundimonas sp. TaxID=1871086 RepID=UPI002768C00E|nr:hypothetical protein [Brevundimonas sp.]MDP3401344.1 hypothetical protein [Brevundimonas sp.]MDZ4110763.1 hypothetical protein [Brevundimonas sp.]